MAANRLYLGTRRYSSWSLRGWLAVRMAGLEVEEVVIPLAGGSTPAVKRAAPSGTVPYLEHDGLRIWDSLAIGEYCAEIAPGLWPAERGRRAWARAVAAEMHSGFRELRIAMPMNLGGHFPGRGRTEGSLADIARIEAVWAECLATHGGPFLFGEDFTLADAFYAPVCARFITWEAELSATSRAYIAAVRAHPLVDQWYRDALAEPPEWRLPKYEDPA
ncbi:glutathione S-transferase family protein [Sabulicella glaciei]|uniref:Glutathione S-transferase family protein n=1 Tax=Sabulicella glaciei TaxID=2984948 RepID=A0ABT3NTL2_9PROT|nr:glutathione S-transferase family protein [Roseococcus sp. MDT2-1-1]MCW8085488.1 glutathione S-transferase family protein [Roseococcus sp. MDT2-1-1]